MFKRVTMLGYDSPNQPTVLKGIYVVTYPIPKCVSFLKMRSLKQFAISVIFIFTTLFPTLAISSAWNGCANELDRLQRATSDAAAAANDVNYKAVDYENCQQYPRLYDQMHDECRSKAYDYQNTVRNFNNSLITVENSIQLVNSSCGINLPSIENLSSIRPMVPNSENSICNIYLGYKSKLPLKELINLCMKSMSKEECQKCLSK